MSTPINPWLMYQAGKALGEMFAGAANESFEREWELEQKRKREKEEKEHEKILKRIEEEKAEREYRMQHPRATQLFNHFEMGNYWYKVPYRW